MQLALYGVYAYTCRNGAAWYTPADKSAVWSSTRCLSYATRQPARTQGRERGSNGAVWYTPADKNAVCTLSVVMRSRTETGEARTARMAARNRPPRALLLIRDDPLRDKVRLAPRVRQPEPNL